MSQILFLDHEREIERLKKLPSTILLDFIRSQVQRLINSLEDLKGPKIQAQDTDDYTFNITQKNDFLLAEKERLTQEVKSLTNALDTELNEKVES